MELEYQLSTEDSLEYQKYPIPETLKATLYEHQLQGYQWLCHLEQQGKGGLLADDMGLGKTSTGASILTATKGKKQT